MATSTASLFNQAGEDTDIWHHLKHVIASSSGFKRWQLEHCIDEQSQDLSLDYRVSRYLRETLEALAY